MALSSLVHILETKPDTSLQVEYLSHIAHTVIGYDNGSALAAVERISNQKEGVFDKENINNAWRIMSRIRILSTTSKNLDD